MILYKEVISIHSHPALILKQETTWAWYSLLSNKNPYQIKLIYHFYHGELTSAIKQKNIVLDFYTMAPMKGYQETAPRKVENEVLRLVKDVKTGSDVKANTRLWRHRVKKNAHLYWQAFRDPSNRPSDPQTPLAGPQTSLTDPQTAPASPQTPPTGPQTPCIEGRQMDG